MATDDLPEFQPEPYPVLNGIPEDVLDAVEGAIISTDDRHAANLGGDLIARVTAAAYGAAVVGDRLDDYEAALRSDVVLAALGAEDVRAALGADPRRAVDVVLANLTRLRRVELAVLAELESVAAGAGTVVMVSALQTILARGGRGTVADELDALRAERDALAGEAATLREHLETDRAALAAARAAAAELERAGAHYRTQLVATERDLDAAERRASALERRENGVLGRTLDPSMTVVAIRDYLLAEASNESEGGE